MQFLGNKPKRHYLNMKTLGISIYISYILGLHPWWVLHAGRVHWCWTSETLGARHGIIIVFYIMSSIRDFRSCTTFWISMLLLSGVGVVAIQGRPTWFPLPPWRPDWWQRGIDGPGGEKKLKKTCEIDYWYNYLWTCKQTLPKAQWTRGLSSYHKLVQKSWSNFDFRISIKH